MPSDPYLGIMTQTDTDADLPTEAIVILGAAMDEHGTPGPAMLRRVARGAALAHEMPDLPIIVAGGALTSPLTEASVKRDLLHGHGIANDRILSEDRSLNTLENLDNTKAIMASHRIDAIYLVTDSFHMPRALMTCRCLNIAAHPRPVWNPTAEVGSWAWAHLREVAALPYYVYRLGRHRFTGRKPPAPHR